MKKRKSDPRIKSDPDLKVCEGWKQLWGTYLFKESAVSPERRVRRCHWKNKAAESLHKKSQELPCGSFSQKRLYVIEMARGEVTKISKFLKYVTYKAKLFYP